MQRIAENYRKIRNTFRYVLGNLDGFDPATDAVPFARDASAGPVHPAAHGGGRRKKFASGTKHSSSIGVYQRLKDFCVVDLSAIYFDVLKDRLYTSAPRSQARRSAQTALWQLGEIWYGLVAPVMSFTADEVWRYLPPAGRSESVHLGTVPCSGRTSPGLAGWGSIRTR